MLSGLMSELVATYPPGFRPRRGLNWFIIGLLYASFYMCRYNFRFATPGMVQEFGFSTFQITGMLSAWSIAYGTGQLINGLLTDRIGGKTAMLIGAAGTIIDQPHLRLRFLRRHLYHLRRDLADEWLHAIVWRARHDQDECRLVPAHRARHLCRHLRFHDSDWGSSRSTISRPSFSPASRSACGSWRRTTGIGSFAFRP